MIFMLEAVREILVFKTNIASAIEQEQIAMILNGDRRIQKWNVDRLDVDCVLRIESEGIRAAEIQNIVSEAGFLCEELAD